MSLLINFFCFNSCTDPFCLVLQLQALCLQRLAFRSSHNSLSSVSLSAIVFILFLMLILCLVLLSLSLHACSHNADRRGNTKGRGNWGAELKISSHGQKKQHFFIVLPLGCVCKNVSVGKQDSLSFTSTFSFLWQPCCKRSCSFC